MPFDDVVFPLNASGASPNAQGNNSDSHEQVMGDGTIESEVPDETDGVSRRAARYRGRRPQRRATEAFTTADPVDPVEPRPVAAPESDSDSLSDTVIAVETAGEAAPVLDNADAPDSAEQPDALLGLVLSPSGTEELGSTPQPAVVYATPVVSPDALVSPTADVFAPADISAKEDPAPPTRSIQRPEHITNVDRSRERALRIAHNPILLETRGLSKRYGGVVAANDVNLDIREGSFYGFVGPNGAGKTTTLSMITGLLKPSSGTVSILERNMWDDSLSAKRLVGALPDRLRLFDRLTGAQLLFYAGILHGLDSAVVNQRAAELSVALGLENALNRLVSDYSAGMQKKIALAAAMIHTPRILVLDEPFESIDPVSAATVTDMLETFVEGGGSVLISSHSIDLIQRVCDHVAIIVDGNVVSSGTVEEVRDGISLEERFTMLTGTEVATEGLEWLHGFSG